MTPDTNKIDMKVLFAESTEEVATNEEALKNITEMERVLLPQLEEIANEIDSSYSQAANVAFDVAKFALSKKVLSSKNPNIVKGGMAVGVATAVIGGAIKMAGRIRSVREYNAKLDELLEIKKKYAKEKIASIKDILPLADKTLEKQEQILSKYMEANLDYSKVLNDDKTFNALSKRNLSALEIYRRAKYCSLMAHHVYTEYNTWIRGRHRSQSGLPGFDTVNQEINKKFYAGKIEQAFEKAMTKNDSEINSKDFYLMTDMHLTALTLDYEPMRPFDTQPTLYFPVPQSDAINDSLSKNKVYQDYMSSRVSIHKSYNQRQWIRRIGNICTALAVLAWIIKVHSWLWITNHGFWAFVAWILGSAAVGIACYTVTNIIESAKTRKMVNSDNDENQKLKDAYGYFEREEIDFSKQSVLENLF